MNVLSTGDLPTLGARRSPRRHGRRFRAWRGVVAVVLAGLATAGGMPISLISPMSPGVPSAAAADDTPWVLPTMPKTCTKDQLAALDIANCLVSSNSGPDERGFGEAPFPWVEPGAVIPWVTLTVGSTGHVVIAVQRALDEAGFDLVDDGDFGSKTQAAVMSFQQREGLTVTGAVDEATAAKLGVENTEPGVFPPPGWNWLGWGYNGSPALAEWDGMMVANTSPIGPMRAGSFRLHREAFALFEGFLTEIVAGGYDIDDLGGYVFRCTSNAGKSCEGLDENSLSNHAYGLSVDFNTWVNPEKRYYRASDGTTACGVPQQTDIPKWVVDTAQKWGLYWGGYGWSGGCKSPTHDLSSVLRDPMHFEFRGTVELARQIIDLNAYRSTPTRLCVRIVDNDGVERPDCSATRQPEAGWRLPIDVDAPEGATAALVNIALTEATAPGFVTAESCGPVENPARQWANGNFPAAGTVSNLSVVPLDGDGRFCLFASAPVQTIVDVQGFFVPAGQGGSGFVAIEQQRVLDTRVGGAPRVNGMTPTPLPDLGPVPAEATAVLLNTAVTEASANGYLSADRCVRFEDGPPESANVNYSRNTTVANLSVVATDGSACLFPMVPTHLVVDVQGAFVPGDGLGLTLVGPKRLVDSRECAVHVSGTDATAISEQCGARVGAGQMVRVDGAGGTAALVNIALTDSTNDLFAVADRCDVLATDRPLRANANTSPGRTISNLGVVPVAEDGSFCVWVSAPTHVVIDIQGVFEPGGALRFVGQDPTRRHDTRLM